MYKPQGKGQHVCNECYQFCDCTSMLDEDRKRIWLCRDCLCPEPDEDYISREFLRHTGFCSSMGAMEGNAYSTMAGNDGISTELANGILSRRLQKNGIPTHSHWQSQGADTQDKLRAAEKALRKLRGNHG